MQERDILTGIAATLTEKPKYTFTVAVNEQMRLSKWAVLDWILKKVKRVKPESERTFDIYPCKVGNIHRVAGRATLLPNELKDGDLSDAIMPIMTEYRNDMTYIVASAIQNNSKEPCHLLIRFIQDNFDVIDLYDAIRESFEGLEMQSFLNSIVLARGTMTVLKPKANPMDGSELIASHTETY